MQPYDAAGHLERFTQPPGTAPVLHGFTWRSGQVAFASADLAGWGTQWTYSGADVPPGGENVRLNLWLFGVPHRSTDARSRSS